MYTGIYRYTGMYMYTGIHMRGTQSAAVRVYYVGHTVHLTSILGVNHHVMVMVTMIETSGDIMLIVVLLMYTPEPCFFLGHV